MNDELIKVYILYSIIIICVFTNTSRRSIEFTQSSKSKLNLHNISASKSDLNYNALLK